MTEKRGCGHPSLPHRVVVCANVSTPLLGLHLALCASAGHLAEQRSTIHLRPDQCSVLQTARGERTKGRLECTHSQCAMCSRRRRASTYVLEGASKMPSPNLDCPRKLPDDVPQSIWRFAISTCRARPLNVRRCSTDHAKHASECVPYMKRPCPAKIGLPLRSLLYGMFTADNAVQKSPSVPPMLLKNLTMSSSSASNEMFAT